MKSKSKPKKTESSSKPKKAPAVKTKKTVSVKAKAVTAEIVDKETELDDELYRPESGSRIDEFDADSSILGDPDPEPDTNSSKVAKKLVSKSSNLPAAKNRNEVATVDPVAVYLRELRKYPLITKEKELELAKKYYDTKDPQAAQELITSNLRFVVKVAAEYSKFGARLIDLVQEGNMGLMHAVREFNPYKGVRLITYAVWWIRGYIQEYLMKQYSLVKIGTTQNQKKLFYRLQKEKEALDALGEKPSIALISSKLGIPEEEVQEMSRRIQGRDVSLNQPISGENSSTLIDSQRSQNLDMDEVIGNQEEINILKKHIDSLIPTLNPREKILLEERLLADEPLTLQEIGEKYGITREAVRQAEARLMKKIKDKISEDFLK